MCSSARTWFWIPRWNKIFTFPKKKKKDQIAPSGFRPIFWFFETEVIPLKCLAEAKHFASTTDRGSCTAKFRWRMIPIDNILTCNDSTCGSGKWCVQKLTMKESGGVNPAGKHISWTRERWFCFQDINLTWNEDFVMNNGNELLLLTLLTNCRLFLLFSNSNKAIHKLLWLRSWSALSLWWRLTLFV